MGSSHAGSLDREAYAVEDRLRDRFEGTRVVYPSLLLGRPVSLIYGAAHGSEGPQSFELSIADYAQGDLTGDGLDEAVMRVEESLCTETCQILQAVDIWGVRRGRVVRLARIPLTTSHAYDIRALVLEEGLLRISSTGPRASLPKLIMTQLWSLRETGPLLIDTLFTAPDDPEDEGC